MPHDHHHHDHPAHAHAGRGHEHTEAPTIAASLIGASAGARLGLATIATALVWAGVFWAMA